MLDLLIIGAGLAGLTAATRAAEVGLRVRVIAKGFGALHWSAATIDVLGYLPGHQALVEYPTEAVANLEPDHPYRRLGPRAVDAALSWFGELSARVGLSYAGSDPRGMNLILPSPAGAGRPAFLAPLAQRAGDLRQRQPMLIVGFTGMRDFYPSLIADNLAAQGHPARALLLPLDIISAAQDRNTVQLATALDEEQLQRRLAETLRGLVAPGERIGLPAVLGLHRHAEAMALIPRVAGAPVFEIPTLPPSVPGIRLTTALRRHLGELGVRVEVGMEAVGFEAAGDTIRWVETATSARPIRHQAQRYLLATGGVLGGGFDSDAQGRFWEGVFGLPLTTPQDRRRWFRPLFLDPAGQPVWRGGVPVDGCWQPIDAAGRPVYRNLWVAGGVLAHADPILERSLEGIALATAFAAVGEMTR